MSDRVQITVLAVGQGMGNLIELYDNHGNLEKLLLIDCGGGGKGSIEVRDSAFYILDAMARRAQVLGRPAGIRSLDILIISHQDKDHHNIIKNMLNYANNNIEIERFIRFREAYSTLQNSYHGFRTLVNNSLTATGGSFIFRDGSGYHAGFTQRFLSLSNNVKLIRIYTNAVGGDACNTVSAVLELRCNINGHIYRVIFPGDATLQTMQAVNGIQLPAGYGCHVMSAPHHGSFTTCRDNTPAGTGVLHTFLNQLNPTEMIISAGGPNQHGHPHATFVAEADNILPAGTAAAHSRLNNPTDNRGKANLGFIMVTNRLYSTSHQNAGGNPPGWYDHYWYSIDAAGIHDGMNLVQTRNGRFFQSLNMKGKNSTKICSYKATAMPGMASQKRKE